MCRVPRWIEAHEAGRAPPVNLDATSEDVLEDVSLETLQEYAADGDSDADAIAE